MESGDPQQQQLTCWDRASDRTRMAFDLASALAMTAWASPVGTQVCRHHVNP